MNSNYIIHIALYAHRSTRRFQISVSGCEAAYALYMKAVATFPSGQILLVDAETAEIIANNEVFMDD